MRRILHLVQASSEAARAPLHHATDAAILACRAAVEHDHSNVHTICLVACTRGEGRADALGLGHHYRITAPLHRPLLAGRALASLSRRLAAERAGPSLVQCWDHSLVSAARSVFSREIAVLTPPNRFPVRTPDAASRAAIRSEMELPVGVPLVGIVADPPHHGDARRLQFATGLFELCGLAVAGVIPAGTRFLDRARRFQRDTRVSVATYVSQLPMWTVLPACDAVLLHSPIDSADDVALADQGEQAERDLSLIACAHSASVPVIAPARTDPRSVEYNALITDDCRARSAKPNEMARSLLLLLEQGTEARHTLGARLQADWQRSRYNVERTDQITASWARATAPAVADAVR